VAQKHVVVWPPRAFQRIFADLEIELGRLAQAAFGFADMAIVAVLVRLAVANLAAQIVLVFGVKGVFRADDMAVFALRRAGRVITVLRVRVCRVKLVRIVARGALRIEHIHQLRQQHRLAYRASYSYAGKYYTLDDIAEYDEHGLWAFRNVYFSKHGSLLNTAEALVCTSEAGYFAHELQQLFRVHVQNALLKLFSSGRLRRESLDEAYLYLSPVNWKLQLDLRKRILEAATMPEEYPHSAFAHPDVRRCLNDFLAALNEQQRRLYVGFESMKLGHGGDTIMSKVTGMNVKTIARGRHELLSRQITIDRVRQAGAGKHRGEKKTPSSMSWKR
jgi:hypothetical protein